MSEQTYTIADIRPNDVIEVGSLANFVKFEDMIARHINNGVAELYLRIQPLDWSMWLGRAPIHQDLWPKNSPSATLTNIALQAMEDPIARLYDAAQRGKRPGPSMSRKPPNTASDPLHSLHQGYTLLANVKARVGNTVYRQAHAEIWYHPIPIVQRPDISPRQNPLGYGGRTVHRRTTRAELRETAVDFTAINRRIGFHMLRES